MSKEFDRLRGQTSLKSKLKVSNEMTFIDLLGELGYRSGFQTDEEVELFGKIAKIAKIHTERQLKTIAEWHKKEVEKLFPSEEDIHKYIQGAFGYSQEEYVAEQEEAFRSGCDWYNNEIQANLIKNKK